MAHFAGLDVSLDETSICIVDETGAIVREGKTPSDPSALVSWFAALKLTVERLGFEAGPLSPWLYEGLRTAGLPAICIETRRMRSATALMAVKTDSKDARVIAQAMRVGWFTAVHVKTAEAQELRLLLTNRKTLLQKRVAIDNEVRGTLKAFGLKLGKVSQATFEKRVLELLADQERLLAMVRPMLVAREALHRQYAVLHRMVLDAVRSSVICRQLMTVPGVGPVIALAYVTAVDDPGRFARSRNVGAHFGLTPRRYASGEIDRSGAISKSGDRLAREALVQAALTLLTRVRRWSAVKAWGLAIAKRRGLRRATVAVARKLAVLMHRMWMDGAEFRWSRQDGVPA